MQREPRSHHYVPEFYLNGFVDGVASQREKKTVLWAYERNRPIRKSTPNREARQKDFYAFVSQGKRRNDVEHALSDIETMAAELIRKSHQTGFVYKRDDKAQMAFFVGLMFSRVPATREFSSKLHERVLEEWREESEDEVALSEFCQRVKSEANVEVPTEEVRRLRLKWAQKFDEHKDLVGLQEMLRLAGTLGLHLLEMNWQILTAPDEDEKFLTTDSPVITSQVAQKQMIFGLGFGRPGVEVQFPLSSKQCLLMGAALNEGRSKATRTGVRDCNKKMLVCARRFAYGAEKSPSLQKVFDKLGGTLRYGENAFRSTDTNPPQ